MPVADINFAFQFITVSEGQIVNNSVMVSSPTVNMLQNLVNGKAALTTINGQQVIIRSAASPIASGM